MISSEDGQRIAIAAYVAVMNLKQIVMFQNSLDPEYLKERIDKVQMSLSLMKIIYSDATEDLWVEK